MNPTSIFDDYQAHELPMNVEDDEAKLAPRLFSHNCNLGQLNNTISTTCKTKLDH